MRPGYDRLGHTAPRPRPRPRRASACLLVAAATAGFALVASPSRSRLVLASVPTPATAAAPAHADVAAVEAPLEIPAVHSAALAKAFRQVDDLAADVQRRGVVPNFGRRAADILRSALANAGVEEGDDSAGIEQVVDAPLQALFQQQLSELQVRAADRYEAEMELRPNPLEAGLAAEKAFLQGARDLVRPGSHWSFTLEHKDLLARLGASFGRDSQLVQEQGKTGHGKHVTIEVIRKLQQQAAGVQRQLETRGAFPWNVKWQYHLENSPLGFRGQYNQGRSVVELLLMPSQDPRHKKNLLNRLGPLNLAVAFDMLL